MCGHGVPVWLQYNRSLFYIVTCRLTVSESCFPTGFVNTVLRSGRSLRAHPAFLFVAHYSCTGPFRRFRRSASKGVLRQAPRSCHVLWNTLEVVKPRVSDHVITDASFSEDEEQMPASAETTQKHCEPENSSSASACRITLSLFRVLTCQGRRTWCRGCGVVRMPATNYGLLTDCYGGSATLLVHALRASTLR